MHSPHPIPSTRIFPKTKSRADLKRKLIKLIRALAVLNIYPSVYSMFSYAWCSSYLLMHNKSYQRLASNNNQYIISRGFYGSGIWEGLGWMVLAGGISRGCGSRGLAKHLSSSGLSPLCLASLWDLLCASSHHGRLRAVSAPGRVA